MRFHEIFDTKHDVDVNWSSSANIHTGKFDFNNEHYTISIEKQELENMPNPSDIYSVDFYHTDKQGNRSFKSTNFGNSKDVMGIIANNVISKFQSLSKLPDILLIRVSKISHENTPEQVEKRKRLYASIMRKMGSSLGYSQSMPWVEGPSMTSTVYSLKSLNPIERIIASNHLRGK
jgi:hypothetical protein